jgi:histidinol-phosphatase (PHP family)
MCRSAIARDIHEIGFSEHYDLHAREPNRDWLKPEAWWAALQACRTEFAGRLIIRAGVEIGEPHIFQAETQALLARMPFDYVLGSLHWVGDESVFDRTYFAARQPDQAYEQFFIELERMTRVGGFDILSHFDVPIRTAHFVYGPTYDVRVYEEVVRAVLRNCVENGIALDLNTAALRRPANLLTPGEEILGWYVDMGGERVTLGSDAHQPAHVGMHLEVALRTAQAAGLKYVTHFEQRQARLEPIC